jgi:hypothetical protein
MATFDAVSDFSATSNPNSPWSYGWESSLGGAFTLDAVEDSGTVSGIDAWQGPENCGANQLFPIVGFNHTGSTLNYNSGVSQPADMLQLHPSCTGKFSVVRFTAPATGSFSVTGLFKGIDTRNTTTDVHVLQNSTTSLFSGNIIGFGNQSPFNFTVFMAAGETLDFAVGFGSNGSFNYDSTGLAVTITGPIFNIADGDVAGLIAAINCANASGGPTTINLAPNGTYVLTSVAEGSEWPSGLPIIRTPITINGNGSTIRRSSAPDTPSFIILVVSWTPEDPSKHANLILDGVTLTGGAGPIGGLALSNSMALVRNSTITYNSGSGDNGGGIHNHCSSLTIHNSTISYNTNESGFGGGGIMHREFDGCSATTSISFSTIFENRNNGWGRGDAMATRDSGPGSVVVKNSIFASPTRGAGSACWSGPGVLVSDGHNIGGDASCGFNGPGDLNSTNPLLGPTTNNGGPTPTNLPLCNSPAIDAVPVADSTDVNGVPITTDQRGVSRPQGAASDIGAVEVFRSQTLTIPSKAGPWSPALNPTFDYGVHDNTPPVVIDASSGIAFTPGSTLTVTYLNGTVQAGAGYPFNDANGLPGYVTNYYTGGNSNFPAFYMNPGPDVLSMELVGTFANNGVIVGRPFPIGNGPTVLTIPTSANQLLLGINDNRYGDNSGSFNVAVSSTSPTSLSVTAPNDSSASADENCQAVIPDYVAGTTVLGGSGTVTLSQNPSAGTRVGLGPYTVTVTATDGCGNRNSDTVVFTVVDNTPPTVSCPTSSRASADDSCQARVPNVLNGVTASDNCGSVTLSQSPAAGTLVGLGTTTITVTAMDASNNSITCTTTFTVADNTPPLFASDPMVDNAVLWSPDHKMVDVAVNYAANDNCGAAVCTLSVTSNEPVNGTGDGDMAPDWEIVDAHHVRLRAERAGTGSGRIYTITVTCVDVDGNSSSRSVTVNVPKSQN